MYPPPSSSSASSSSSHPQSSNIGQTGLTRYGSAPGSLLTSTVDALIGGGSRLLPGGGHHYFSSGDSTTCKDHRSSSPSSYDAAASSFGGSALLRQKSSPAGFLTHLATTSTHNHNHNHNHSHNGGFTITRAGGSRLKSELSFTDGHGHGQECLSRISENNASAVAPPTHTESPFGMHSWGDNNSSNSIVFSAHPPKRSKTTNDSDILHCLTALDSQFSLPQTTLEMATVEKLLHIPEDSVPCKIRAKRGCATHPRSIAERERRTRISGKLKKLQDLVPNMDKQTSYADMLDLAVQHIKGLQSQVQTLHNELESCTCGCKQST